MEGSRGWRGLLGLAGGLRARGARGREAHRLDDEIERRVAERTRELEETNQRLALANRELEAFSYSVSHDLRAPLRHIAGFATMLKDDGALPRDSEAQRHVGVILDAATRMGTMIDDLLAFSRMAAVEMRRTPVSLQDLVAEVRQQLEVETVGRGVVWTVGPLPTVPADPGMLRVVLVNLLGNALKYTRPRVQAQVEIECTQRADEVTVCVRDNGVGFDMRYADKLFGVFQRLHSEQEFEGSGIGLAIVQRIVQRHGGRVWAEGAVDRGAAVYFSLPLGASGESK